jgi:hypothetical protein
MTLKSARNLNSRQIKKVSSKAFVESLAKKRINEKLVRELVFNSTDSNVLTACIDNLLKKAESGDQRTSLFLKNIANEKNNPNVQSRRRLFHIVSDMPFGRMKKYFQILSIGVSDSDVHVNQNSAKGLATLAEKGVTETLPFLNQCTKNKNVLNIQWFAVLGLEALSRQGEKRTLSGLTRGLLTFELEITKVSKRGLKHLMEHKVKVIPFLLRIALTEEDLSKKAAISSFFAELASQGNKEAQSALEKFQKTKVVKL